MAAHRFRARFTVDRWTGSTPRSLMTRRLSSFEVASTNRASTSWKNASSSTTPNPSRSHEPRITSTSSCDALPSTTATPARGRPPVPGSKSSSGWLAASLTLPACISAANWASVWAEPRCSTILRCPCFFSTICTAVAPEAVFTFRRNGLTALILPRFLVPQPAQPKPPDKRLCPHSHPKSDLEVQLRTGFRGLHSSRPCPPTFQLAQKGKKAIGHLHQLTTGATHHAPSRLHEEHHDQLPHTPDRPAEALSRRHGPQADWSAAMFSDCPQPECDDFYAANVSGP
ncbi:hypothetical protein ACFPRL_01195 [Pseudoclavibacter helvolus]